MYRCRLLSPLSSHDALVHNEGVLASPVLGIEVTVPSLAARCTLGNIDPQHGDHGSEDTSAIEAALTHPLPATGSTLATIRPDADALGAMAVLLLRSEGRAPDAELCEAIGRADALGPRAFELPVVARHRNAVIAAGWRSLSSDVPVEDRVEWMKRLLLGDVPAADIERMVATSQDELERARRSLTVSSLPGGRVSLVVGRSPRALEVGYQTGTRIVVSWTEGFLRPGAAPNEAAVDKWTIARWSAIEPLDVRGLCAALNQMERASGGEPAWGGPENLVSSPQGASSRIPPEHVLATVLYHTHPAGA